ncbi:DEAD/DEAH box helicase domain protein [Thermogladius calderae 1633]|uniref:DEAD/DEAH box helicase domain protein n=1 Tax=Thermogladius calderae (strain DSM 22663 / VKM B-2946 / 1633) TaxID=1184251 RepID=I3TE65_THEC1|nr:DEAD/DEAH box helicase domain protein [Thermogladius calderae 1633]
MSTGFSSLKSIDKAIPRVILFDALPVATMALILLAYIMFLVVFAICYRYSHDTKLVERGVHLVGSGDLLHNVRSSVWAILGGLDDCGVNVVNSMCLRGVSVRLLLPNSTPWELIGRLGSCVEVRFYSGLLGARGLWVVDGKAYRGPCRLTCDVVSRPIALRELPSGLERFERLWGRARANTQGYVEVAEPRFGACIRSNLEYATLTLEPYVRPLLNVVEDLTLRLRGGLVRLLRGSWYPFTLLNPRLQQLLKKKGFKEPTPIQVLAIPRVLAGRNLLVVAPTGSGKTESVLLPVISKLLDERERRGGLVGVKVLYVTPMRALCHDIAERIRGLTRPLFDGSSDPVGEWHSDVDRDVKDEICTTPPLILVTTPESLELILDTRPECWKRLANVDYVVVDEVHEVISGKRGEQILILLERLRRLTGGRIQRLFISATLPNPDLIARLLGGSDGPVEVVRDPRSRVVEARMIMVGDDEELVTALVNAIGDDKGYLVFVNTRALAELLHHKLNKKGVKDIGVHHGSVAPAIRRELERMFREGRLRGLVATRTLELGVDIGSAEKVALLGSPRLPEYFAQRVGRSSHKPHTVSKVALIALDATDVLELIAIMSMLSRRRLVGYEVYTPSLDVIAREILAETYRSGGRGVGVSEVRELLRLAFPYTADLDEGLEELIEELADKGLLKRAGDRLLLGDEFRRVWDRRAWKSFFSFIPPREEVKIVDMSGNEVGAVDVANLVFIRPGSVIRLAGRVWRVVDIKPEKSGRREIRVVATDTDEFTIPIWKSGGIPVHASVAVEVYRLLGRLSELGERRVARFGSLRVELDDSIRGLLRELSKVKHYVAPGYRTMVVDRIASRVFKVKPRKLGLTRGYDLVVTTMLYPFGSKISNTITSILLAGSRRDEVVYVLPKPYGILVVHKPSLDVVKYLLNVDQREIKESIKTHPICWL